MFRKLLKMWILLRPTHWLILIALCVLTCAGYWLLWSEIRLEHGKWRLENKLTDKDLCIYHSYYTAFKPLSKLGESLTPDQHAWSGMWCPCGTTVRVFR